MPLTPINVIDVTDPAYGAAGNGIADDTQAIKDALNAFSTLYIDMSAGVALSSVPMLYFPQGKYKITSKISFNDYHSALKIVGDNAILLAGAAFNDYAFYHPSCYDVKIEGINFINFKKALYMGNPHPYNPGYAYRDTAQWTVESCAFQMNEEALAIYGQSSVVNIEKCKFYKNELAVNILTGDKVIMKDNWITAGVMKNRVIGQEIFRPAQIENNSVLEFDCNLLVPESPEEGTLEPAWINNYHSVKALKVRQGAEPGSFTLINNFAGSSLPVSDPPNGLDATAISVKDSQCYAVYGNNHSATPKIIHPAIVRYIDKIPNSTVIRNNVGLVDCRLIDFSYDLYYKPGHMGNISNVFADSGAAMSPHSYIEVANNTRGIMYDHGNYLPLSLYPLVRDEESLWPLRRGNEIEIQSRVIDDVNKTIDYTFEYGTGRNAVYMIQYSGCPRTSSVYYSGGFVGLLKANGYWTGSDVAQSLRLEPLFNKIGDGPDNPMWPTGEFPVSIFWDATGNSQMLESSTNRKFHVKIGNRDGNGAYDFIKVTQLALV